MINDQKLEAQQVLDGLLKEGLIPFKLRVGSMIEEHFSYYVVQFYDSRIRALNFSWQEGEPFREIFRTAVLDRVAKMSGPITENGVSQT